jgi:hypothetical protein
MTNFKAHVKAANVNIHEKKISISLVMLMDDENMEKARELAFYISKGELFFTANPRQIAMPMPDFSNLPIEK